MGEQKANIIASLHQRFDSPPAPNPHAGWGITEIDVEEGRKRVLGIMASILVTRHLKTPEDLHDSRPSPRTEALVASAVEWAERIMRRIDGTFANSADDKRWPRT